MLNEGKIDREPSNEINLGPVFTGLKQVLGQQNKENLILEGDSTELKLNGVETAKITPKGISVLGEDFTDRIRSREEGSDTFDPEKLQKFFQDIGGSIERINHLGISYFCDSFEDEQSRLTKLVKSKGLEIYNDTSTPEGKRWFFVGDKSNPNDPLFEIVLTEGKEDSVDDFNPHIQIDIDTNLPIEEIEKLVEGEFGTITSTLKIPPYLWMGILGKTGGIKIALGVGTNSRNNKEWREDEMRAI